MVTTDLDVDEVASESHRVEMKAKAEAEARRPIRIPECR